MKITQKEYEDEYKEQKRMDDQEMEAERLHDEMIENEVNDAIMEKQEKLRADLLEDICAL